MLEILEALVVFFVVFPALLGLAQGLFFGTLIHLAKTREANERIQIAQRQAKGTAK